MLRFWSLYKAAVMLPVLPVIWVVTSVIGVVAGPFGTIVSQSFFNRLIFWPVILAVAILIGAALRVIVQDYLGLRRYLPELFSLAVLATLVLTPPFYLICAALATSDPASAPNALEMAAYVFITSMATSTLRHALASESAIAQRSEVRNSEGPPRIYDRLSGDQTQPILRMQVRDHYVDVVRPSGTESVLIRFADAIAEAEGIPGLRVHRSHWVATDAILAVRRERSKMFLRTSDGALIPVSRTYMSDVEAIDLPEKQAAAE